ncbi:hypothetical protein AAFF_G00139540 [Aldrovandia affinis]|uniref:AN1-type zinc finger protein 4 n=1 Tax=Aldrovandia affinis TaxID=143900 RepID=A0AAD7X2T8_9TELE|nr:hypothetical protein AAFF_G00139540 [Aldrovandia affinis]
MEDKKEPPFFNEDNVGPFHFKLPCYKTIEVLIETLTGTCFELHVSPFETVVSVKAKIQRLEGIPVAQQHLIWNNMELEDDCCLYDYNIAEGCTLKLVLAMRGGPINTRRVAVDDSVKEMAEYMDAGRDEAPPNKQVTYLVYREGDQLNFFRVVDRGDGNLTPVSESVRGSSIYNLYTEEEEEGENSASGQQALENSITMSKMKLLKAKMENMNLNKKPKKTAKLKPRPPVGPRPCSGYLAPSRHHRPFRVLPQIGQSLAPVTHLPPARDQQSAASGAGPSFAHLSLSSLPGPTPTGQALLRDVEEEPWEHPALGKLRPPPKVSRIEVGGAKLLKDRMLPPLSVLANRGVSDGAMEEAQPHVAGVALIEESVPADPKKTLPFGDKRPGPVTLDLSPQEVGSGDSIGPVAEQLPVAPLLSQVVGPVSMDTWAMGPHQALLGPPDLTVASSPAQCPPQPLEFPGSLWPASSRSLLKAEERAVAVAPPPPARFRSIKVESPGKRAELISKSEARDITEMANKASKEPLGSVSNAGLLASLARGRSREGGLGRLCTTAVPLATGIHLIQEDLLLGPGASFMSANSSAGGPSSSMRRVGTPTYLLPPVKACAGSKKKASKHCFLCGKKTGLATSFECRCGNNFCTMHRYAETHDCSYDYKGAGRRFLQETNPIITAPKLPKI